MSRLEYIGGNGLVFFELKVLSFDGYFIRRLEKCLGFRGLALNRSVLYRILWTILLRLGEFFEGIMKGVFIFRELISKDFF